MNQDNNVNGDIKIPEHLEDSLEVLVESNFGDSNELEDIRARVREMEEEAAKLKQMQNEDFLQLKKKLRLMADLFIANAEELENHFHGCGPVNRVTILVDKYNGKPKGFAYIEFADKDSINSALALDESLFRGRQIKVTPKRTNQPGISSTNRRPRRSFRRPYFNPYSPYPTRRPGRLRGRRPAYWNLSGLF